jgi:hypothetical protein
VQVDDRGPGKEKGFVDSLPPGQEQQADRGMTLNPATIHSDLDDVVTLGLSPDQELQPDRGLTLNLDTIHSDLDNIVTLGLPSSQELQADPGGALNSDTIHSDLGNIVTLGLSPSQELQADRGMTLTPETIHSDPDDIATRGLPPSLEVNLHRGKSLPAGWRTIVSDTDDTSAAALPHRWWELGDDRVKMLRPTNAELDDDDDKWKLVPYFGAVLVFFSWIVQGELGAIKRKAARLKFEPNALRSPGSVNGPRRFTLEDRFKPSGARPPALDKFAAAFSIWRTTAKAG